MNAPKSKLVPMVNRWALHFSEALGLLGLSLASVNKSTARASRTVILDNNVAVTVL